MSTVENVNLPDDGWADDDDETTPDLETEDNENSDDDNPDANLETEDDENTDDGKPRKGRNREAGYRKRARDAEAARDTLVARLTKLNRATVERIATVRLVDGGDVWRYGAELGKLVDDSGDVDEEAVTAFLDTLTEERPHLAKRRKLPAPDKSQGAGKNATGPMDWSGAMRVLVK